jgi:hypothetical protein
VHEGVQFYSNGDCYEGEFHKVCYNFFGKGNWGSTRGTRSTRHRELGARQPVPRTVSPGPPP